MVRKIRKKKPKIVGFINDVRIKTTESKWEGLIEKSKQVAYADEKIYLTTVDNPHPNRKGR